MADQFAGKVALVTGAGSGIGRASALAFAREKAKVVVSDIVPQSGKGTVQLIEELGGEAVYLGADVSELKEVEEMIGRISALYGRLDYAHNNAGILTKRGLVHEFSEEEWDTHINVNLKGTWLCMKYEIPLMLRNGGGAIVNTSSMVGLIGWAGGAPYAVSKHGINGLTKTAALDYGTSGIRVNSVCPGTILTPLVKELWEAHPETKADAIANHPIGRVGTPEEVAEAVVWLCSDAASFVTGVCMPVDGGYTTR